MVSTDVLQETKCEKIRRLVKEKETPTQADRYVYNIQRKRNSLTIVRISSTIEKA